MLWATPQAAMADEGMWLFNDLPRQQLKSKYGFEPTAEWARHVMLACVRFNSGGSASFVSSTGLVLTNHHVGSDTLQKLSTPENNYLRDGFYAATREAELKTPDLELNQLVSIDDVTGRVQAAVKDGLSPADAFAARRAVMSQIEKESLDATGLRSDVVTLFGGAKYHLYRYKKYTDVRLVWAPETAAAFFGGDADNFEYPRYCLDVCLFRVYENDEPAQIEHFLKWSETGAGDGELVFVSGNPGRTSRIYTVAALKHLRDKHFPARLDFLRRLEVMLSQYSLEGPEQERRARDDLFSVQNARKAYYGMLAGLQDPDIMGAKQAAEEELLAQVKTDENLQDKQDAWQRIEAAQAARAKLMKRHELLESGMAFRSRLFRIARALVRMAEEDQKPDADRLSEFNEAGRESLLQQLYSTAPVYEDLEIATLADSLSSLAEQLGGDHPLVRRVLAGRSPQQRATQLVTGTRLADVSARRELAESGAEAITASRDPMLRLARLVDKPARNVRKKWEEEVVEAERQAYAAIADVLVATQGTDTYPDATFTLRLAYGTVAGYEENGRPVPPWTTMGGAFGHEQAHESKEPWQLPASWHEHKGDVDLTTPLNFVCTADIIGGNSGSPVINRDAELVGVIFDGNIQSLTSDYIYSDTVARAVSVHASAVKEALRSIHGAGKLADELGK